VAGLLSIRTLFQPPGKRYFGVCKIEHDQVADYAARKGCSIAETERWLAPVLNYIPTGDATPSLAPDGPVPVAANDVAGRRWRRIRRGVRVRCI
jgi:5-methyltetrahydrofolate--homocysteine methyltransferase